MQKIINYILNGWLYITAFVMIYPVYVVIDVITLSKNIVKNIFLILTIPFLLVLICFNEFTLKETWKEFKFNLKSLIDSVYQLIFCPLTGFTKVTQEIHKRLKDG